MEVASATIYWAVVLLWMAVLVTAAKVYLKYRGSYRALGLLLLVVSIDGIRNIIENTYFGLYFGSRYGLLSEQLSEVLGAPHFLIIPKMFNIVAASFVLWLLILRCLPEMFRDQASAKNALAVEIEEHRRLLETSPDLIVVTDAQRIIQRISHSCSSILGYAPADLVGRYGGDFIDGADLPRVRQVMERSAETGEAQIFQATFLHRNGRKVPLDFSGVWSPLAGSKTAAEYKMKFPK